VYIHKRIERNESDMPTVTFSAYGHENVLGTHRTTLEVTTEDFLTKRGTCIVGIRANMTLAEMPPEIKRLARLDSTAITLRMTVADQTREVNGRGSHGLTYDDATSMVARTSPYESGRTLMVRADKAAIHLDREFVKLLADKSTEILCEIEYVSL
jgi:hypothetical protein